LCVQDLVTAKSILSTQKIDFDDEGDDTINWDGSSAVTTKIGLFGILRWNVIFTNDTLL